MVALALVGVSLWYVLRPAAAAARAFDAGLRAQVAGDLDAARESFEAALERRPDMAEAALSLGFACLGFHGAELREGSIRDLFERARRGRTADLDAADAAFGRCITAALRRPPERRVRALFASTNREMIAVAWKGRAASALTRAAAAHDVAQFRDGDAWATVALNALDQADRALPSDDTALLREVADSLRRRR